MLSDLKFVEGCWVGEYKFCMFKVGNILCEVILFYVE